jgi:hypothetical protein
MDPSTEVPSHAVSLKGEPPAASPAVSSRMAASARPPLRVDRAENVIVTVDYGDGGRAHAFFNAAFDAMICTQ